MSFGNNLVMVKFAYTLISRISREQKSVQKCIQQHYLNIHNRLNTNICAIFTTKFRTVIELLHSLEM